MATSRKGGRRVRQSSGSVLPATRRNVRKPWTLRTAWLLFIVAFGFTALQSGSGAQPFVTSVTIASPAAVLEPSAGIASDQDGFPPGAGNADPEEATLAIRLAIATPVTDPVLVITRSNDEGTPDLFINDAASDGTTLSRGLDGLDGVIDGRLAAGAYTVYVSLDKTGYDQALPGSSAGT